MYYKSHPSAIDRNNSFAIKIEDLVREIVIQNEIPYYRIESGVDLSAAEGAEEGYMPVIRVITYFEDTVNKISHILHDEFNVDIERSVDKKKIRIETFAYKNINYTATLNTERQQQTEYKRSGNKKFEIQICSMLQDAWSGIEKELGYDDIALPDEAKRDFYRVGALLEMADIEFLKIRTEHSRRTAGKTMPPAAQLPASTVVLPQAQERTTNTFTEHLQTVVKEAAADAHKTAVAQEITIQEPQIIQQPLAEVKPEVISLVSPQEIRIPEVKVALVDEPVANISPLPEIKIEMPQTESVAMPITEIKVETPQALPVVASIPEIKVPEVKVEIPQAAPVIVPEIKTATIVTETVRVAAEAHMPRAINIGVSQPIAQPRTQAPTGIAPKPAVVPSVESVTNSIAASANINIENLKELANSINQTESKINVAAPTPPPVVMPIPTPAAETLMQAPSPEVVIPAVEKVIADPQSPIVPQVAATVSNLNVNGSGMIEKATEVIRETTLEKTIPFHTEMAKQAKVTQADENAQMTDVTLREYVMTSKVLKEIDQMIADRAGAKINSDIDIEGDVERLRFLKVYSLKQLHERLMDNKNDIVAFAEKWIGKDNGGSFDSGISLFYLEYLLVGKKNDPAFAVEYVVKFISDNDYSARYIIPTYNSIHNTEAPNFSHLTLKA